MTCSSITLAQETELTFKTVVLTSVASYIFVCKSGLIFKDWPTWGIVCCCCYVGICFLSFAAFTVWDAADTFKGFYWGDSNILITCWLLPMLPDLWSAPLVISGSSDWSSTASISFKALCFNFFDGDMWLGGPHFILFRVLKGLRPAKFQLAVLHGCDWRGAYNFFLGA